MNKLIDNYTFVCRDNDFDSKSKLIPTQVLDYFQTIAGRHATKLGLGFREFKQLNLCWVLVKTRYKIYKNPNRDGFVELTSWPLKPNRIEYNRCYQMKDIDGDLLVEGSSKWCIVDFVSHKISRYQAEFPGEFKEECTNIEFDKEYLRENVLDEEVLKSYNFNGVHTVRTSDLDLNMHMNNTKYAVLVYDVLNTNKEIDEFEIDYVNQSLLNDKISVYSKEIDNKSVVVGINKDTNHVIFKSLVIYK